ncbi:phosphatase PAP2 family protein [Litoreibacter albidus]|uniref:PAP2 superfamily protein n=1 Tax=Litoreibacter albidus TaxID=670155 RepID=A0A1H2UTS5_9RHOB|nr:phosphatase PAP2 family protein [Litoreibacter albidus]SDW59338.1 PAP2 superfamily protein [Litoreibacter albidus]
MRNFFYFSVIYTAFAIALVMVLRDDPVTLLTVALLKSVVLAKSLGGYLKLFGIALLLVLYLTRHTGLRNRLVPSLYAIWGCLIFAAGFSLFKTSIPFVVPFWADPLMANVDAALHGDIAPWQLAHGLSEFINPNVVTFLYFGLWTLPAVFLPLIIAITDGDHARHKRFLILYALCWVGLGNVLATAFSSVGPVYYDPLLGSTRFADLTVALISSGITDSTLGLVQQNLWLDYSEKSQAIGSGISAFPSVHVGISTVVALYLAERSKWLAPLGLAFLAVIGFISVYNGWHYAVDGYASVIVMVTAWWALHKYAQPRRNVAIATYIPA